MRFTSWEAFSSHSVVMILQGASTQTEAKMGSKMARVPPGGSSQLQKRNSATHEKQRGGGDGCDVGWCACWWEEDQRTTDDGVNGAPNVLQNVTSALAKQKSAEKSI